MQTITVKLDYATMRFLKEMMKDIKEIKNNSRRSTRRHEDVSSVQRRSRVRSRNMMLEARGFGGIAKKRRKKKKEFLSPREKKIQKLKNRPTHWQGLE